MGASGGSSGISAAQMGQIATSMKNAQAGQRAAESESQLMDLGAGGGSGGGEPMLDEQYLSAMDDEEKKRKIAEMIESIGSKLGDGYMG